VQVVVACCIPTFARPDACIQSCFHASMLVHSLGVVLDRQSVLPCCLLHKPASQLARTKERAKLIHCTSRGATHVAFAPCKVRVYGLHVHGRVLLGTISFQNPVLLLQ
jgi:hypothetical protein